MRCHILTLKLLKTHIHSEREMKYLIQCFKWGDTFIFIIIINVVMYDMTDHKVRSVLKKINLIYVLRIRTYTYNVPISLNVNRMQIKSEMKEEKRKIKIIIVW